MLSSARKTAARRAPERMAARQCVVILLLIGFSVSLRAQISFVKSTLAGASSTNPTTLQFGPDERLYVGQQNGSIKVYTIERIASNQYAVTATEDIQLVHGIANHDDDGAANPAQTDRQVTGLLVVGTAANPVLYVSSSDPRIGGGGGATDTNLDTNSGIITRLTWNGASWDQLDLVCGLPRSEENHSTNGFALDAAAGRLYVAQGGHTNMGARSNNFSFQSEYALSACVLVVDLNHPLIGSQAYELPTLDDPSRANEVRLFNGVPREVDVGDPLGGNNGENQAVIDPNGPVQVYAAGFRNAYDLVLTDDGRLYTIDNGPNSGWGGPPESACDWSAVGEADSRSYNDALHFIGNVQTDPPGMYYGGHPNLFRGSESNLIHGQSPIPPGSGDPRECVYQRPKGAPSAPPAPHDQENAALCSWSSSTNGMVEYRASNFGAGLQGNLLAAQWNSGHIVRVELNAPGDDIAGPPTVLFSNVGGSQLDLTAQGDFDVFPGTIWSAAYSDSTIFVFEPADFSECLGLNDPNLDEDGDGYSNADEIDNGTDACNPSDVPPDFDDDGVSDRNDTDDDDDGIADADDAFARDATNGRTTQPPIDYGWATGEPGTGLLGLGFTGLMTNGVTDYLDQYDPAALTPGGAAGIFTIDVVTAGDALGATNTQENSFQLGVNVSSATGPFRVHTGLASPLFDGMAPVDFQSFGLMIGTGDQDNYVKLVLSANGGAGGLDVVAETTGAVSSTAYAIPEILSATFVELYLDIDPAAGTVQARYALDEGTVTALGGPVALEGALLTAVQTTDQALAVGIISTSAGSGMPFAASWDFLRVTALPSDAAANVLIGPTSGTITGASTYDNGSFQITNDSTGGQNITRVTYDFTTCMIADLVFDPDGIAGDTVAKPFTPNSGSVGTVTHSFDSSFHNGVDANDGYDRLRIDFTDFDPGQTFTFSIDVDPTSIKGVAAPGPGEAGSVSGLELAGARVTIEFDDGSILVGEVHRVPGSVTASQNNLRTPGLATPSITAVGVGAEPAQVANANQVVRVTGPAGADVNVLVFDGAFFEQPGGGYDVDPYETNSIVAVSDVTATIGAGGSVDVPITLTRTQNEAGINQIAAVLVDSDQTGPQSNTIVLQLVDAALTSNPAAVDFGFVTIGDIETLPVTLTNIGATPLDITDLQIEATPPFSLVSPPAPPITIAALGGSVVLNVEFAPVDATAVTGALTATHTGDGSLLVVPLSGHGMPEQQEVLYRINAGGPEIAANDGGPAWLADSGASSPFRTSGSSTATFPTDGVDATVPPSTPVSVFDSERWDAPAAPEMRWMLPVTAGTEVEVRVYLKNGYAGTSTPGTRVFNVTLEGAPFVADIDLAAEVGHRIGTMRSATVISDGTINIDFMHGVENPLVNAIEVLAAPVACPGDLDGDRDVDLTDLALLLSDFDCVGACGGDVDGDGDTDLTDLALLLANFDESCS